MNPESKSDQILKIGDKEIKNGDTVRVMVGLEGNMKSIEGKLMSWGSRFAIVKIEVPGDPMPGRLSIPIEEFKEWQILNIVAESMNTTPSGRQGPRQVREILKKANLTDEDIRRMTGI